MKLFNNKNNSKVRFHGFSEEKEYQNSKTEIKSYDILYGPNQGHISAVSYGKVLIVEGYVTAQNTGISSRKYANWSVLYVWFNWAGWSNNNWKFDTKYFI